MHGGNSELSNLAWACFQCNTHKGTNIASYDHETGHLTPLYNPRLHRWEDHFVMQKDAVISGLTDIGRVTVRILNINSTVQLETRRQLLRSGKI